MQPSRHPAPSSRFRAPVRAALLCGTALALFSLAGAPAFAGEIEDMKAQLEALQQRIEQLEGQQQSQRKHLETVPKKRIVTSGKDAVNLSLSGQVNRVSFFADDGTESQFFHSDNENSSTRWRLVGKARINDEWSVGTLIEQDIGQTNNSASVGIDQNQSASDTSFDNRHLTFDIISKRLGRVRFGKGDPASNNIAQLDLSGTSVIEYTGLEDIGGGLKFRTEDAAAPDGPKVSGGSDATGSGVYTQYDGLSRRNRIEYDTPTIGGFTAGFSHIQGDAWDATLRYKANYKQAGLKVAAGIGYWSYGERSSKKTASGSVSGGAITGAGSVETSIPLDDGVGGSISVLHKSGANLTFSAGTVNRSDGATVDDPVGFFIKPGWQLDLTPLGKTNISGHYARNDDMQAQNDEFTSWGFAVVQNIDRAALELFAFFRQYSLDRDDEDFEDINIAGIGGRVKF